MRLAWLAAVTLLVACGGGDDATQPDAGGTGTVCGGFLGTPCEATHYCDWPDNSCGAADGTGTCQPRPTGCDANYEPTCGCDSAVHGNTCVAAAAGADVSAYNFCTPPADTFACGQFFCTIDAQYCQQQVSDIAGSADDFTCFAVPAACGGAPDCACLEAEACGDACTMTGDGYRLTCPGG